MIFLLINFFVNHGKISCLSLFLIFSNMYNKGSFSKYFYPVTLCLMPFLSFKENCIINFTSSSHSLGVVDALLHL